MKLILVLTVLMSLTLVYAAIKPVDLQQAGVQEVQKVSQDEILSTNPGKPESDLAA